MQFLLQNVTQLVAEIHIPDVVYGIHPKVVRRKFSELKRLESQGFTLFHASQSYGWKLHKDFKHHFDDGCCFKLGYIHRSTNMYARQWNDFHFDVKIY